MSELNEIISEYLSAFIMGFAGVIILMAIMMIVQGAKLRRMRSRYEAMMGGNGIEDLENLLVNLKNQGICWRRSSWSRRRCLKRHIPKCAA